MGSSVRVRLYSRTTCHLCEEARSVIEREAARTPFELEEITIDGDDELERDYGIRVPVVEIDGREEFEYVVDAERLHLLVAGARGRRRLRDRLAGR